MKHRNDIDGLRALAIVPVILFHYQVNGMSGGFLGVDVFFVISGFLITKIVYGDVSTNRFSIRRFYERRVRRIFPALFAVLAATLAVGFFVFLPVEFEDLGKSMLATTLFVSNFYFFHTDSYFGPVSAHQPLLHTWSLAVEEQFYLVFPIGLAFLAKTGKRGTIRTVAGAAIASLAYDAWLIATGQPTAAFYLPLSRAWELLAGSLLALEAFPEIRNRVARDVFAGAGAVAIVAAFVLSPAGGSPVVPLAVWPIAGTVLLILAGSGTGSLVTRGLSLAPVTYIGRISYSLYLWHWPIYVLYYLNVIPETLLDHKFIPIAITFAIGALSERFIEAPFRKPAVAGTHTPILRFGAVAMSVSVAAGLTLLFGHGLTWRFPPAVDRLASYIRYDSPATFRSGTCFLEPLTPNGTFAHFLTTTCLAKDPHRKNVLLLGDSHAAALWIGLSRTFPEINFMQATVAGCRPFLQTRKKTAGGDTVCADTMHYLFQTFIPENHLDGVIVTQRWREDDLPGLIAAVRTLGKIQKDVVVIGPIQEYAHALPRVLAFGALHNDPNMPQKEHMSVLDGLDDRMARALRGAPVMYLSIDRTFCSGTTCRTQTPDGTPMQFDDDHLTDEGSIYVARQWKSSGGLAELEDIAH